MISSRDAGVIAEGVIELLEESPLTIDELAKKLDLRVGDISTLLGDMLSQDQVELEYESADAGYITYVKLKNR
ncbi:MAG: hypothetical protein ACFFD4_24120 [Candidatus Odinarchaeota archaeon]